MGRLLLTAFGAVFAAVMSWMTAMIIGALVSGISGDFMPGLRMIEGLIGAISGAIAGGCLAFQDKHQKGYGLGLFARVALVSSGLPLMRLAAYQDQWLTALFFMGLGTGLFLIGCILVFEIVLDTGAIAGHMSGPASVLESLRKVGAIPALTYLPLGVALLVVGAYASGGISLTCQRAGTTQVDCELTETRWLGVVGKKTLLRDVQQVRSEAEKIVLVTPYYEVPVVGGIVNDVFIISYSLEDFLDSSRPTLTVTLPPRWIFFGFSLIAGMLIWLGFSTDLLSTIPETRWGRGSESIWDWFGSPLLIFGVVACLWGVSFFLIIIPGVEEYIAEETSRPVLTNMAMISSAQPGTEAFIQGRISEINKAGVHNLVMAQASHETTDGWQPYPAMDVTPPFWIDIPGSGPASQRRLWVFNDTYGLDVTIDPPQEWLPDKPIEGKMLRYRGYAPGDFVTLEGRIERVDNEPQFQTWLVYGRPVVEIVKGSKKGIFRARVAGGGLLTLGGLLLTVFVISRVVKQH
jgi:hypothetical protein